MPPQAPYTTEMTDVCFIVPVISPVYDPASRKPPHTRPHRITEVTARDSRNQSRNPRIHPRPRAPAWTPSAILRVIYKITRAKEQDIQPPMNADFDGYTERV